MTSRTPRLALVALAVVALSACSSAIGVDETSSAARGTIELAVSETCAEASGPECVSANGESIVLPSVFERAGVKDAAVAEGAGQNVVEVTFDEDGAAVLHSLSEEAAEAGSSARLVIKTGGEIQAAVTVMQKLQSNQLQVAISPDDSAQDFVDLIHGG